MARSRLEEEEEVLVFEGVKAAAICSNAFHVLRTNNDGPLNALISLERTWNRSEDKGTSERRRQLWTERNS